RVADIIDPSKIDYLISNHVEMDHSGSLPAVLARCPQAEVITSAPNGLKGLTLHYGEHAYHAVKSGDSLNLGKRSLTFVQTPMVHWPDNMVTYCPEEKILFSNDAFGQHYASGLRFDDQEPLDLILQEAKKYFANIVMPYWKQANGAVKIVSELPLAMIAPSHGIIWRSHIDDILAAYGDWTSGEPHGEALIVFDSMWNSTEKIARVIEEAFVAKGTAVRYFDLKTSHISDIIPHVLDAQYIAVGSPTLNNGMLPTVAAFLCYLKGLSPKGRAAFAFGSYGWGGQSVALMEEELVKCGFSICLPGIRLQYIPTAQQLAEVARSIAAL
ncbi:MAG: FprA family A-type flavoprotein, partial [Clostridiales bacterium]